VQGAILVVSAIFVSANLLVDLLYTVIDPRIRYE
jgi:ABC-type dipeptide/oligopeptide/nickel transport system permease component